MAAAGGKPTIAEGPFISRLRKLTASLKAGGAAWNGAAALAVGAGPAVDNDDLRYLKSVALHQWLIGYELTDTVLMFTPDALYAVTVQNKARMLEAVAAAARDQLGVTITVFVRPKGTDGAEQLQQLQDAAAALPGPVGVVEKEFGRAHGSHEGPLLARWAAGLRPAGAETTVDASVAVADLFAAKDEEEVKHARKAAHVAAKLISDKIVPAMEDAFDGGKRVKHSALGEAADAAAVAPETLGIRLKADRLDLAFPTVVQSGGVYDLRPSAASSDEHLHQGVVIVSVGVKYASYCATAARTYMIDPPAAVKAHYGAALACQAAVIASLVPGATLGAVHAAGVAALRAAAEATGGLAAADALETKLTRTLGTGIGLELRELPYAIKAGSAAIVAPGMVFAVSAGLQGLEDAAATDARDRAYAILVADTVVVMASGGAEVLTGGVSKDPGEVVYNLEGDDAAAAERTRPESKAPRDKAAKPPPPKSKPATDAPTGARPSALRQVQPTAGAGDDDAKRAAAESARAKANAETLRRLTDANKATEAAEAAAAARGKGADIVVYRTPDEIPAPPGGDAGLQVDKSREALLIPVYGLLVPFHVSTVKSIASNQDGSHALVRINFNVPGSAFGAAGYPPALKHPDLTFLREITYRASDVRHANAVVADVKTLRKLVLTRESEKAERATLVTQEDLKIAKGVRAPRLLDLWPKPSAGGRGRKTSGSLEAHANGFRFHSQTEGNIDVLYRNIQHAIFQPSDNELVTLLHFRLHSPIMVGKKKTRDVQFFCEVMEAVQALDTGRRSAYDPDELEEEQRDRERRNRINNEFKAFVTKVTELWERDHSRLELEFDIPYRELGFTGVPYKESAYLMPTVNCLVELTGNPTLVVTLSDIEIVCLERVELGGTKSFDMVVVFKDFTKDVHMIQAIPSKKLDALKDWLTTQSIPFYESRINLVWKNILKTIKEDPAAFIQEGGWGMIFGADEDEGGQGEGESESEEYAPSDGGSSEEAEDSAGSGDESESYADSDDDDGGSDGSEGDEEEEEGLDWDQLEANAIREERDKGRMSDEDDDRPKKRKGAPVAPPRKGPPASGGGMFKKPSTGGSSGFQGKSGSGGDAGPSKSALPSSKKSKF